MITSVLDQFDLSDLQKKAIRSVLESAQYEPPSTSQPSVPSSEAPGLAQSLLSLREPSDISSEVGLSTSFHVVDTTLAGFANYRREG